jgi:hypothetical protein
VSIVWVVLVALVPGGSRPYVDGTANDSIFTMVFGYNGLERFGVHLPGSMPQLITLVHWPYVPGRGWAKLFSGHLAPQIAWLIPVALIALVVGWRTRGGDRAGYVIWGGAWLSYALALSAAGQLPHTAYVVALAAPMAALVGPFLLDLAHMGWRVIAAVVVVQAGWTAWVWTVEPSFAEWLRWGALALAVLVLLNLRRSIPPRAVALGLGVTLLIGPMTWTLSTLNPAYAGSDVDATAGPPGPTFPGTPSPAQVTLFGSAGLDFAVPGPQLSGDAATVWQLAKDRQGTATYPLTTVGWFLASPFILATGERIWPIGGYSHLIPSPSLAQFQDAVTSGRVRMVLLGAYGLRAAIRDDSASTEIVQWVASHCTHLQAWTYTSPLGTTFAAVHLFDCGLAH